VNAEEAAETQAGAANDGTDILVSDATQLAELAWSHDEPEPEAHGIGGGLRGLSRRFSWCAAR